MLILVLEDPFPPWSGTLVSIMQDSAQKHLSWDFPGGAVMNNVPSSVGGLTFIPGWGTMITCVLLLKNQTHKTETMS